jgi:phage gp46-like protein
VLALQADPESGEGVLVYSEGCLVDSGFDLQTAVRMSLECDAPAQPGDVLPEGTPRRGFWADAYDDDGEILGSRLWLLEGAECSEATAARAKVYAEEALRPLLARGYARAFEYHTTVGDEAIELFIVTTLKSGAQETLGPFKGN